MSPLLTQREAAKLLRLSERTMERLRVSGDGPKFVKAGHSIRYRVQDIEAWCVARVVGSTSQPLKAV
jgi:predicted DNA-binding transcriptional regulator AlpA